MVNVIVRVVHLLRFIVVDRVRSDDTKELVNVATENSPLFITQPGSHGYRMSRRTRSVVYDGEIVKRNAAVGLKPRDKVQKFPRVVEFPSFFGSTGILLITKKGLNSKINRIFR